MSHTILVVVLAFSAAASRSHDEPTPAAYRASYELEAKGDFDGALAKLTPLSAAGNNSCFLLVRLAWLRYLAGNFASAESSYRSAIAAKPKAVKPKVGLTLALFVLGNWKALNVACRDALASLPADPGLRTRPPGLRPVQHGPISRCRRFLPQAHRRLSGHARTRGGSS